MLIGELASQTGSTARALRYYEEKGLISSERSANGYRDYSGSLVPRVGQIRELLRVGLGVRVIKQILPCLASPDTILFEELSPETRELLETERDALGKRIICLTSSRDAINDYLMLLSSTEAADVPRETR